MAEHEHAHDHGADDDASCRCSGSSSELVRFSVDYAGNRFAPVDFGAVCTDAGVPFERRLDEVQHDYTDEIVSTMHVHLDHHNCLEILALKGRGKRVYELADRLLGLRGVKHGELTCAATKQSLGL